MVGGAFGIESVGVSFEDGDSSSDGYQAVIKADDKVLHDHRRLGYDGSGT